MNGTDLKNNNFKVVLVIFGTAMKTANRSCYSRASGHDLLYKEKRKGEVADVYVRRTIYDDECSTLLFVMYQRREICGR
jgi:hypothetical protein